MVSAATEVINGVEYQVVYLDGDNTANLDKINAANQNRTLNYRYVLTADWRLSSNYDNIRFYCQSALIIDLNGWRVDVAGSFYMGFHVGTVTIMDSSPAQTGSLGWICLATFDSCHTLILKGGYKRSTIDLHASGRVIVQGGDYQLSILTYGDASLTELSVAPWLQRTEQNGRITATKAYAAYAVSTTPYAAGIYNYAYGYQWEIAARELSNLAIPTDKTYYLWGRDKDGWYQYLNLTCTDGQTWRNAA